MRDSKFFSVLADEAQDCSNKEQMPVIIRFVDKDKEIREEFFRFSDLCFVTLVLAARHLQKL